MKTPMPSNNQLDDVADHGDVRYESRDVRIKPLFAFAGGLAVLVVLVAVAVAGLFHLFSVELDRVARPSPAVDEANLAHELQNLRDHENEMLTGFGWVSREEGIVRIPIDRAIDLALEKARTSDESK